jgi:hypothetical protein
MQHTSSLKAAFVTLLLLASLGFAAESKVPSRRVVLQPVHEYFNLNEVIAAKRRGEIILNGFLNYTHLGSDFGFLGPGDAPCDKCPAVCVCVKTPGAWGGVWHSLNRLAREQVPLDLRAVYPSQIAAAFQPRIVGVQMVASGSGVMKLEFKTDIAGSEVKPDGATWSRQFQLKGDRQPEIFNADISPEEIRTAQYLNWVAEPGAAVKVDSLSLRVELPDVDFPTYVFLSSYAKFARCYSEQTGLVRDRAHTPARTFANVPATGMFALATVAAKQLGIVSDDTARTILRRSAQAILDLPRMRGLLPHFVEQTNGKWTPIAASEYSTVDTALCLISLRLAANALNDEATATQALELLRGIDMSRLRDADGYVLHGLTNDGRPLPSIWRDWGGETALVLMMQRISAGTSMEPRMDVSGRSYRGIGFITELPALFFPQFNTNARAHAGAVDWLAYRQRRLAEQKAYFPKHAPGSLAAEMGLYGLSAGEGANGVGYLASGVDDPDQRTIYPHYILMSALVEASTSSVYDLLGKMETRGWLTPWGLVENIGADGKAYLPMIGSLNASFEALSSYHLLMQHRKQDNALYQVASADPIFQDAIKAVFQ